MTDAWCRRVVDIPTGSARCLFWSETLSGINVFTRCCMGRNCLKMLRNIYGKKIWKSSRSLGLLVVLMVVILSGCGSEKEEQAKEAAKAKAASAAKVKPVLVELAGVRRGKIEEILERSAALQAEEQVLVLARAQNPAVELLVEEGDLVEKDQVILRLENDSQLTNYNQAKSQTDKAKIEFDRVEKLFDQSLISESEYVNAQFTYNQAKLAEEEAKRQLDFTEVKAPIKGTITSRSVKVGDKVTTGTPIFEIIDLDSTVAVIHVPEQYLPKLKKDMPARLISTTLGDTVFEGYVKRISPVVDAEAGTVKVVVGVKNRGALSPGMWVNVELVLDENENAILIPKRSITYSVDQTFAFTIYTDTNGVRRAERKLVEPRNADKENIEPMEGFQEGDIIVVAGQAGLKEDSPIRELGEKVPESPGGSSSESLDKGSKQVFKPKAKSKFSK